MWCKTQWGGSGQGQIDPLKETDAAIKKINYNLSNYEDEHTAIYGGDWESAFNRKVREASLIKENGQQPIMSRSGKIELDIESSTSTQEED
jgi:capsid protein